MLVLTRTGRRNLTKRNTSHSQKIGSQLTNKNAIVTTNNMQYNSKHFPNGGHMPEFVAHRSYAWWNRKTEEPESSTGLIDDVLEEMQEIEADKQVEVDATVRARRTHATARKTQIQSSTLKVKEVCRQIRNLPVEEALRQLHLNQRKVSLPISKTVIMARNNAINLGLPKDNLWIAGYYIGRQKHSKKMFVHGRGKYGIVKKPKTQIIIFVAPQENLKGKKHERQRTKDAIKKRFAEHHANKKSKASTKIENLEQVNE
eukprot:TRINITY_DN2943_c0_g1_i1.p1 TRINITY_DN2943_c0_g1~~TRINITY_DN2943_c0_g1_i1.p1  ORF type:complete len:258 (-),score=39.02 TRINITY_DN2943_c0_g1_i1:62-835(-)